MRFIGAICLWLAVQAGATAAEGIGVPWEDFKMLYEEKFQRQIADEAERLTAKASAQVHSVEEAVYQLKITATGASGEALITGKVISGGPEPIGLFGNDLVLTGAAQVTGGSLVAGTTETQKILFHPEKETRGFQIGVSFLAEVREDNRSKIVTFAIPRALRNEIQVSLPEGARIMEATGIADENGRYRFSLRDRMEIRFLEKEGLAAAAPLDVDIFSVVDVAGKRLVATSHFAPAQTGSMPIEVKLPASAQFISSSVKASEISKAEGNIFQVRMPADEETFSITYAMEATTPTSFTLELPTIADNNGREGDFVVNEPDDAQVRIAEEGVTDRIPLSRLIPALRREAGERPVILQANAGATVAIGLERFEAVSAPTVVLDSQYYFASFEENGNSLAVLVMEVPPELGNRLSLVPVPDSTVWSLKINGENRKLYASRADEWIVPLDEGKVSRVELALLRKGEKLGLNGRLEFVVPETGLAARSLGVGIALPERVELRSLEGPVNPAHGGEGWPMPEDFIGRRHFFSKTFHNGEQLNLAVSYKEPVKP